MRRFQLIFAYFILSSVGFASAQIKFPNGNVLNLYTANNLMYLETRIIFNTGKYKADDYRWEKISDSLHNKWFVTACFNGDCRNDLLQSGNFMSDFGLNDTTCFIAFHVETFGFNGSSVIKYKVYNKNNPSDSAHLIYNIHYTDEAAIQKPAHAQIRIVNPVRNVISILNVNEPIEEVILMDYQGKEVAKWNTPTPIGNTLLLEKPVSLNGLCLLKLKINGGEVIRKVLLQNN